MRRRSSNGYAGYAGHDGRSLFTVITGLDPPARSEAFPVNDETRCCVRSEAIQRFMQRPLDCFVAVAPRNDEEE
jgi:hypothetical protein